MVTVPFIQRGHRDYRVGGINLPLITIDLRDTMFYQVLNVSAFVCWCVCVGVRVCVRESVCEGVRVCERESVCVRVCVFVYINRYLQTSMLPLLLVAGAAATDWGCSGRPGTEKLHDGAFT